MQILDDKRGRFATLDTQSFVYMTIAMKIFLDKCISPRHVKGALRLANMSITFHKLLLDHPTTPESSATSATTTTTTATAHGQHKHYIQCETEIRQHELWHTAGFWEDALSHGLGEQMVMMDPVQWDELEPEMLSEKVMGMFVSMLVGDVCCFACISRNLVHISRAVLCYAMLCCAVWCHNCYCEELKGDWLCFMHSPVHLPCVSLQQFTTLCSGSWVPWPSPCMRWAWKKLM